MSKNLRIWLLRIALLYAVFNTVLVLAAAGHTATSVGQKVFISLGVVCWGLIGFRVLSLVEPEEEKKS